MIINQNKREAAARIVPYFAAALFDYIKKAIELNNLSQFLIPPTKQASMD